MGKVASVMVLSSDRICSSVDRAMAWWAWDLRFESGSGGSLFPKTAILGTCQGLITFRANVCKALAMVYGWGRADTCQTVGNALPLVGKMHQFSNQALAEPLHSKPEVLVETLVRAAHIFSKV